MSPLSSRALRGQAPRRRYVVATQPMARPAQALKARRCAQDVEWQGQPGIEPGRTLAVAAGLLACASKHNGLLHEVWPVVRKLTLCPHRCGCRLAPFGFTQPPLCLAPLRPCTRHQRCSCRAQSRSACWPWLRHRRRGSQPGASRSLDGWPRPSTIRPRGAPQRYAITGSHQQKREDHHARANHHRCHA